VKAVRLIAIVGLLAVATAACGGDDNNDTDNSSNEGSATAVSGSAVPFDRAFIDAMVPHHDSAIAMAQAAKREGLSQPDLIKIANDIIRSQQAEIDEMVAWRKEWFGSAEIDPAGAATLGLSKSEMGMLHRPEDLSGTEDVDQAFAEMMIDHHEGAIRMAELARERGQHEQVRDVAARIIEAQQREIDVMEEHAEAGHHP
jgi:uncharacterized protein (DUF305 family)